MNPIIKEADFRRQIKSAPRPCYFFFGEEDYLKNAAIKQAYSAICADPAFDIFNYAVIDGREYTPDKLLVCIRRFPSFSRARGEFSSLSRR